MRDRWTGGDGGGQVDGDKMDERGGALRVSTHHIVEADTPALKEDLPGEAVDKGEPELEHKQRDGHETNNQLEGDLGERRRRGWPHFT